MSKNNKKRTVKCKCGLSISKDGMDKHLDTKRHKKFMKEVDREKHNEYMREKIECECGLMVSRVNIIRHRETERHMKVVDKEAYIKLMENRYDEKIRKLKREKRRALRKIDKEIEESKADFNKDR